MKKYNSLGELLASSGQLSEAADHFQKAVDAQPDNRAAQANLEKANAILKRDEQ